MTIPQTPEMIEATLIRNGFEMVEHEYDNGETGDAWRFKTANGFALARDRGGGGVPMPDDWSVCAWRPAEDDEEPDLDLQDNDAHAPCPNWLEQALIWAKEAIA